ncbi:MAG: sigma-70 family RNA polymerase sigma factor [Deltaproteobacteria bacterium]|nr:sigma-70 family RNA polymerase sigma factor [Deltaproteobacteria bacterium]
MDRTHGFEAWSDEELRGRMLAREGRAWREFHVRFDRLVYRCIQKVTTRFSRSLGSDDVREIYAQFLLSLTARDMHKLRTFSPERGNKLSSWIGMLATNAAWDHLRSVARAPASAALTEAESVQAPGGDPYEQLLERERWAKVSDALQTFSEKDQTFVRLYYMDGLTPEEVAEEMQISVKTVYSKKHKIRSRLEQVLSPLASEAA